MVPTEGRAGQGMVKSQAKVRAQQAAAVPARKLIIKPLKSAPLPCRTDAPESATCVPACVNAFRPNEPRARSHAAWRVCRVCGAAAGCEQRAGTACLRCRAALIKQGPLIMPAHAGSGRKHACHHLSPAASWQSSHRCAALQRPSCCQRKMRPAWRGRARRSPPTSGRRGSLAQEAERHCLVSAVLRPPRRQAEAPGRL